MFVPESRNKIETYDLFLYQHKWLAWRRIFSFLGKMNYFGAIFFTSLLTYFSDPFGIQANPGKLSITPHSHGRTSIDPLAGLPLPGRRVSQLSDFWTSRFVR